MHTSVYTYIRPNAQKVLLQILCDFALYCTLKSNKFVATTKVSLAKHSGKVLYIQYDHGHWCDMCPPKNILFTHQQELNQLMFMQYNTLYVRIHIHIYVSVRVCSVCMYLCSVCMWLWLYSVCVCVCVVRMYTNESMHVRKHTNTVNVYMQSRDSLLIFSGIFV